MLSPREQDAYDFIVKFIREHGHAPLLTEIGEGMGISSKGVVHRYISALEEAGMIEKTGRHRGIRIIAEEEVAPGCIPMLGSIAAGQPIEAISNEDSLDLNHLFAGSNRYALKVKGESMIEEGIYDGDWVIIEQANAAKNYDIVVALVEGQDVTLKTIEYMAHNQVKLIPANSSMEPMVYSADEVQIQGILKGQLRVY